MPTRRAKSVGSTLAANIPPTAEITTLPLRVTASISTGEQCLEIRGVTELTVVLPTTGGPPQKLNVSFLSQLPKLGPAILAGFREWAGDKRQSTRRNLLALIRLHFCNFLQKTGASDLGLNELEETHLNSFVNWLNKATTSTGRPITPLYRQDALLAVRSVFEGMLTHEHYRGDAQRLIGMFPMRSFPGAARKSQPTERLSTDRLRTILHAAEAEILSTAALLTEADELIRKGAPHVGVKVTSLTPYRDKATALAELASTGTIPTLRTLELTNRHLFNALGRHGGLRKLTRYLFPYPRDLVPFVLLLTISAAYNPETVLSLTWRQIVEDDVLGTRMIRLLGSKGRSGTQVLPLAADAVNGVGLGMALEQIRRWTRRIVPLASYADRERVFLYVTNKDHPEAKSFGLKNRDDAVDSTWAYSLKKFCRENRIGHFTLKQIRTTVLDEMQQQTGDLMVSKQLGRHKNPTTTWSHYTSDGTRQRYIEKLGAVFLLRERWLASNGVIDPQNRTVKQDKGSATPGFLCFDPYDSPQPNQQQGRLCNAYGRCPSCPLSAANISDIASVASYQALRRTLVYSQSLMSPQVFALQWAEVLEDLDNLLGQVPANVRERASALIFNLPPVG